MWTTSMRTTSVIVAVIAVYFSYAGLSLVSQNWGHIRHGWAAIQKLENMPQEHIDDFFKAYERLSAS